MASQGHYTLRGMVKAIVLGGYFGQDTRKRRAMLLKRLRRIEEDRSCVSLVIQLAAVRSGIDSLTRAVAIWGRVRVGDVASEVEQTSGEK